MASVVKIQAGFLPIKVKDSWFLGDALEDGDNLYLSGHISHVSEESDMITGSVTIKGSCTPTMRVNQAMYSIELKLDKNRTIESGHCQCQAGILATCKHSAALFHFINKFRVESCTDRLVKWKGSKKDYHEGKRIKDMFPKKSVQKKFPDFNVKASLKFKKWNCPILQYEEAFQN